MKRSPILWTIVLGLLAGTAYAEDGAGEDFAAVADMLKSCEVCHGMSGASIQSQYPILAGQEFYYLYVQLKDFKSGLREDPIMSPLASVLGKEQMQLMAKYFSEQTWPHTEQVVEDAQRNIGLTVIVAGQCVACHLGAFHGNSRVPRLAGQHAEYLEKTMLDFKSKSRKNSPAKGSLMASFSDEEITAVAEHLSALRD